MSDLCPISREELARFFDGELPPNRITAVEAALRDYPDLRKQLTMLQHLQDAGKSAFYEEPEPSYWTSLTTRILARTTGLQAPPVTALVPQPLAMGARIGRLLESLFGALAGPRLAYGLAAVVALALLSTQINFQTFLNPVAPSTDEWALLQEPVAHSTADAGVSPADASAPVTERVPEAIPPAVASLPTTDESTTPAAPAAISRSTSPQFLTVLEPLHDPPTLVPLSLDGDAQQRGADLTSLLNEPDLREARRISDPGILNSGGVPAVQEEPGALALRSGESVGRTLFSGQYSGNQQEPPTDFRPELAWDRMSLAALVARKSALAQALEQQDDPLLQNITIKNLDDVYQRILSKDNTGQYREEARDFYRQHQDPLLALLGRSAYQQRLRALGR